LPEAREWVINEDMTLAEFGQANALPNPVLKSIFELQTRTDLQKKLSDYGTPKQINALVQKKLALAAEHASKNWIKILIKFILWFAFLVTVFVFFKAKNVGAERRKWFLFVSILLFGVAMGSDPSPMGTVKDAIHLYGSSGAVFPPRMIALTVFLLIVFAVNKYICAWGCQLGVLQDLIFRLNQHGAKKAILGNPYKPPFVIANSVRFIFLFLLTLAAFTWGIDIVGPIDPFKIYKPMALGLAGIIFIGLVLIASLFVYRPWCHFFCPFGLVGWLVEKISRVKISVDYETCIACQKCVGACPSTVMAAILKQDKKTIPDCFACYSCRDVCPTQSIHFTSRKRTSPPPGHFDRKKKADPPTP
jgi:polyferredoxin